MEGAVSVSIRTGKQKNVSRSLLTRVVVPITKFRLVDVLKDYGHYPAWEDFMEQAIRTACERYFNDAEKLLGGALKNGSKPSLKGLGE